MIVYYNKKTQIIKNLAQRNQITSLRYQIIDVHFHGFFLKHIFTLGYFGL